MTLLEKLNLALKEHSSDICYLDYEVAVDIYKRLLELEEANNHERIYPPSRVYRSNNG
jgi:hypothetical protein